MKNKALFLDRDGTINVEKNYLYKIDDFEFIKETVDLYNKLSIEEQKNYSYKSICEK